MDKVDDVTVLLEEMKQYLSYDPETGHFTWIKLKLCSPVKVGDIAGCLSDGYILINFNSKKYRAHRMSWLFTYGKWPDKHVDHIDGNRSNNKINNLRDVTAQENAFNMTKIKSKSGYLGVSKHKSSWRSRIMLNGVDMYIGTFDTPELASEAYQAAKLKYHNIEDANLNQENFINRKPIVRKISTSGYRGVTKTNHGKWMAKIGLNNTTSYLGVFDSPELASEAVQAAKLKYHVIGDKVES